MTMPPTAPGNAPADGLPGYSGATRLYPLVGDPVAQTKSPSRLTRAFVEAGHDAVVVPVAVAPADVAAFLAMARRLRNVDGFLATVPHKFAAFEHADTASPRATLLRSANVLRREPDGRFHADMLDGIGFVAGIEAAGCTIAGGRALVVGAGGAGSAIALALLDAGVAHLAVHDVDGARREALLAKLATIHAGKVGPGSADPAGVDIIVNATPLGMRAGDPSPVDLDAIGPAMFVGDVITAPEMTPLLLAARAADCRFQTGIGMHDASLDLLRDFYFPPARKRPPEGRAGMAASPLIGG